MEKINFKKLRGKNILFVTPFDEPLSGADESLLLLIDELKKTTELNLHVLAPLKSNYLVRYNQKGATVHPFNLSRLRRSLSPFYWAKQFFLFLYELLYLPYLLKKLKIDVVHLNMHVCLGPHLAALLCATPVVVHYRAKTLDKPKWFFDVYLSFIFKISKKFICISQAVENHFLSRKLIGKTCTLYNPIDDRFFNVRESRDPYEEYQTLPKKILFLGRIHPQKRIHVLLHAFEIISREHKDIQLMLVGGCADIDIPYFDQQMDFAQMRGLPVIWFGEQRDVLPFLLRSDLLVLPSINEGFGRVIAESFAAKLPVVGANSGAIPEILHGGELGSLFETDNPQDLQQKILTALNSTEIKQKAQKAFEFARNNFSIHSHTGAIEKIYTDLL